MGGGGGSECDVVRAAAFSCSFFFFFFFIPKAMSMWSQSRPPRNNAADPRADTFTVGGGGDGVGEDGGCAPQGVRKKSRARNDDTADGGLEA